jgi:hypothetical protein
LDILSKIKELQRRIDNPVINYNNIGHRRPSLSSNLFERQLLARKFSQDQNSNSLEHRMEIIEQKLEQLISLQINPVEYKRSISE